MFTGLFLALSDCSLVKDSHTFEQELLIFSELDKTLHRLLSNHKQFPCTFNDLESLPLILIISFASLRCTLSIT